MVGFGDVINFLSTAWQWIRSLFVGLGALLKKATVSAGSFFAVSAVIGKAGYDALKDYLSSFMISLQNLSGESLSNDWSAMDYIAFANYVFPLSELLAGVIIIFEFYHAIPCNHCAIIH